MPLIIKPEADSAQVRFPPPFVYVGFLLIGLVIDRVFALNPAIPGDLRLWLGGAAIAAGLATMLAGLLAFRKAGNNVEPWRAASGIVATGVYRYTRNPMYLGLALGMFGLAVAANSLGGLITLPLSIIVIRTQVIAREEAYLAAKFGESYRDYCRHVRRWI